MFTQNEQIYCVEGELIIELIMMLYVSEYILWCQGNTHFLMMEHEGGHQIHVSLHFNYLSLW